MKFRGGGGGGRERGRGLEVGFFFKLIFRKNRHIQSTGPLGGADGDSGAPKQRHRLPLPVSGVLGARLFPPPK